MTFNRLHFIRQVDLFTLRLFLSAVDEQQIGRAAVRENIAASTATKRIQDFEEIAGVPLLERTPKGVVATPAGEVIARYIRKLFADMDDMRAEIAAFSEGLRGEVFVASARSIFVPFLSRATSRRWSTQLSIDQISSHASGCATFSYTCQNAAPDRLRTRRTSAITSRNAARSEGWTR